MERRRPDVPRPGASLTLTGAMSRHAAAMAARQARLGMAADCRRQPAGRASSAGQTACWPWSLTATIQVLSPLDLQYLGDTVESVAYRALWTIAAQQDAHDEFLDSG